MKKKLISVAGFYDTKEQLYFRGAECATGNLKRLRPGSNRLRVVVNLNVAAQSVIRVPSVS